MRELGMKSIVEIAAMTPGVEYDFSTQWGAGILTNLAIRGIDSNVGTSTTGVYIDDAPIQARNANFGNPYPVTFDLARVEVLRGPQGTLFGAGAEGGAIRFVANSPNTTTFDVLYHAELSTTEYGGMSYETGAAIGGPIVDGRVGARLSAWYQKMGGYVDRVDPLTDVTVDKNANESCDSASLWSHSTPCASRRRSRTNLCGLLTRRASTPIFRTREREYFAMASFSLNQPKIASAQLRSNSRRHSVSATLPR
jgi:outer membrane receptor protein involved in Fe transport